ncbi:S-adenosyl-L-methionine-dependent methyltransferase [Gamsiella multidivaricata]|uniref:S-adenosyl-L-methionine-dependent methyltransferase n=1 Tax=Gamsiella multidivaricata TaxID=101098 RepID=UPI00221F0200|nr:S-adenosyl-L-methionine-dependent methyltransferase [Gamsiella multidivaricata]KAG0363379.1 hypothetical protein BGZ54_008182 [Gamsiella multidivaricata]KAI7817747.1 S-adenosyl-L-methionine-dependent methyltransferase [Gamsiella multidivaricata]
MGNSVSTLSSRKSSSTYDLSSPSKPSLFQRSKSSLQFRKRSKSSLSFSDTSNNSSPPNSVQNQPSDHYQHHLQLQVVPDRKGSIDSSDGHSDYSLQSGASDGTNFLASAPKHKNSPLNHQKDSSTVSSSTSSVPNSTLPEWAYHSRRCDDGRTRHAVENVPYMLPNDLTESDRLDAQHYIVRFIFKGNYNVELDREKNIKILDVATGTGVWALEMAHEFPNADVYGVDISAIFPTEIKPKNCHFQLCNILEGLPFPDNHFDFIYQRLLVYALSPAQRKQVNAELLRVLKPEGYLQLVESDGIVYNPGPETEKINQLSLETSLRHGVDPREVQHMKSGLKQAGYTSVNSFNIALPVGNWGGKAGELSQQNMHGLATIWLKGEIGKMDQESCDRVLKLADEEIEKMQSYYKVWLVVGQKPTAAATQLKEAKKAMQAVAAAAAANSGFTSTPSSLGSPSAETPLPLPRPSMTA